MAQEFNKKFIGTEARPRVSVFRSNAAIYAQAIDDATGKTIVFASSKEIKENDKPVQKALLCGKLLAQKAKDKKIEKIIFDRNGYRYHGRVKSLAEGMREGGLVF
ncbi:MAG: 50S ribosomal protein L18 [Patescibacteria group bacterium]